MHIAVCDDELYFRKILIKDLNTYAAEYGLELIIYEYRDGNDLLTSNISFDVIFMDYRMEERNGLDTVSVLRKRNIDTKVIFISSYKEVVFDSMKVNTFRFLVKPYNKLLFKMKKTESMIYILVSMKTFCKMKCEIN